MNALILQGVSLAGSQIISKLITETYKLIQENDDPRVKNVLEEIDLEADLQIIQALVDEIEIDERQEGTLDVVDVALQNVNIMVSIITSELESINHKTIRHRSKSIINAKPAIKSNLDQLIQHKTILDKRVDKLIQLIQLKRFR